jgi:hypothetical protein
MTLLLHHVNAIGVANASWTPKMLSGQHGRHNI